MTVPAPESAEAATVAAVTDGRVLRARELRRDRRAGILAAARAVFARRGYHGSSIGDLLAEAGIARGTFYLHFKSKRAVFEELLDDLLERLDAAIVRVDVGAPRSAHDQLLDNVRRILAILDHDRDLTRLLMFQAVGFDRDFDAKVSEFYGRVRSLIGASVRTGATLGLLRQGDPELRVTFVLGAIKEAVGRQALDVAADRVDRDALAREILDFCLRGMVP